MKVGPQPEDPAESADPHVVHVQPGPDRSAQAESLSTQKRARAVEADRSARKQVGRAGLDGLDDNMREKLALIAKVRPSSTNPARTHG